MSEEFEYIPWSHLADERKAQRNRTIYIAAGVIVAIGLGTLVARSALTQHSVSPPPPTALEAAPAAASAVAASTTSTTTRPLYSEADLMALVEGEATRAVATRAEWFVRDYFTSDRDTALAAEVRGALPSGSPMPELPQDGVSRGPLSYVEWAKASEVLETSPGRFRALVVFRVISGEPLVRRPVRAVELGIAIGGDGGTTVVDLPSPVPVPGGTELRPLPAFDAAPDVAAHAVAGLPAWGGSTEVIGATPVPGGWRLVFVVEGPGGVTWPMVAWIDEAGSLVASDP